MSRSLRLLPAAVALAFLGALAGELLVPGRVIATRDIAQFHLPLRTALVELAHGGIPLWNPWLSGGQPIVSDPSYAVFYPPTWLAALVGPGRSLSLHVVIHLALAFAGAWAMARRLGCRPLTALVAAIGFAGGGVTVSFASALNHLPGAAALPWSLWATDRAVTAVDRRERTTAVAALGAILALTLLNGEPVTLLCGGLAAVCLALARAPRSARWRGLALLAASTAVAAALAAVQLLPALARFGDSARADGLSFEEATTWSLAPARALELVAPRALGDPARVEEGLYFGWGIHDRDFPFLPSIHPGLVVLLLGVVGIAARPIPARAGWAAMAVLGSLLALGRHTPLYAWLHAWMPPFGSLRYPEKFALLPAAALAFAAALALEHWLSERDAGRSGAGDLPLALAAVAAAAAGVGAALVALSPERIAAWIQAHAALPPGPERQAEALALYRVEAGFALAAAVATTLVFLALRQRRLPSMALAGALVALLAVDLVRHHRSLLPALPESAFAAPPVALRLEGQSGRLWSSATFDRQIEIQPISSEPRERRLAARLARLEPWSAMTWKIPYALSADYAVTFTPPLRRAVGRARALWLEADSEPLHRLLGAWGAARLAIRTPADEIAAALVADRPEPPAARLRTNPFALALWRFVPTAEAGGDGDAALAAAVVARLRLHEREFLVDPPWTGERRFDPRARVVSAWVRPHILDLAVETPGEALLVVANTFDRGWSAWADGRPAPVYETGAGYQATVVPAGTRRVRLRYRERWLALGATVSAVAWVALAGVALALRRRRA
ncbi:MAG: hypothetical protein AMXMBFR36_02720 [Acidobacteriota bacterium]